MKIVKATRGHVAALARLMAASPLLRRYRVTARSSRESLGEALRQGDLLLVAAEDGLVVGLAWVITTRALDRTGYLRLLLAAESRRSEGIGAALLARAERGARARSCRHFALLVTTTNRRARAFYQRHGYRHVGYLPGFVRTGIGEALYVKSFRR